MKQASKPYIELTRINKPIGIYLLLWPTMWGLFLANNGKPDIKLVLIFICGVIIMRSAGCIINDIADKDIDPLVTRTKARPLACGSLTVTDALTTLIILATLALTLLLQLSSATWPYAIAAVVITACYPLCKRIIKCPQLVLGIAFSMSIPITYAASHNSVPAQGWLLFIIASIWPVIYDTQYALTDIKDDLKIGVNSSAILFGKHVTKIIGALQLAFFGFMLLFGYYYQFSLIFFIMLTFAAALALYQQYLIKNKQPEKCLQAFNNNKWVGLLILLGIILNFK